MLATGMEDQPIRIIQVHGQKIPGRGGGFRSHRHPGRLRRVGLFLDGRVLAGWVLAVVVVVVVVLLASSSSSSSPPFFSGGTTKCNDEMTQRSASPARSGSSSPTSMRFREFSIS